MTDVLALVPAGRMESARAWRAGRIHVLSLEGDSAAIGRQHGTLARAACHSGAIPHLAAATGSLDGIIDLGPLRRWLALRYVDLLYRRVWKGLSPDYRAELAGIAAGAAMPVSAVFRASLLSEVLQLLVAAGSGTKSDAVARGGCTAALALGSLSAAGLLHGKNQDYDAAGHWDNSPALIITRQRGAHAYAKATSAGLLKGNLALNDRGLSIGGHMLFSSRPGKQGLSFTAFENEIMRRAASLGDAVDILRRGPRLGCFAFVVGDGRADEAAVIECDGDAIAVRPAAQGRLGMANVFTADAAMQARDLLVMGQVDRNPRCRQARIDARLGALVENPVEAIAAILADRIDPVVGVPRAVGPLVAGTMTVTSAIACNTAGMLWMGEATAPTAAGRFIGFDVASAFGGGVPQIIGSFDTTRSDDPLVRAQRCFIAARVAWEEDGNLDLALALLAKGGGFAPDDPAFPRFSARLLLRHSRTALAAERLAAAASISRAPNEIAEVALLNGHLSDMLGKRAAALAYYDTVVAMASTNAPNLARVAPALAKLAADHRQKAFDASAARRLPIAFSLLSGSE